MQKIQTETLPSLALEGTGEDAPNGFRRVTASRVARAARRPAPPSHRAEGGPEWVFPRPSLVARA